MREDHPTLLVGAPDIRKVWGVLLEWKDVVVSTDQNLAPIEARHDRNASNPHRDITKMVDGILLPYDLVPGFDHHLVGFLSTLGPRAKQLALLVGEFVDVVMACVAIGKYEPSFHLSVCLSFLDGMETGTGFEARNL